MGLKMQEGELDVKPPAIASVNDSVVVACIEENLLKTDIIRAQEADRTAPS